MENHKPSHEAEVPSATGKSSLVSYRCRSPIMTPKTGSALPENHPRNREQLEELLYLLPYLKELIPGRAALTVVPKTAFQTQVPKTTPTGRISKQKEWRDKFQALRLATVQDRDLIPDTSSVSMTTSSLPLRDVEECP